MKKILLGFIVVILLFACTQSPEEKVNLLIKESMERGLYHPETYSPAGTRIDSAFTPFDDPEFYDKTLQLYKLTKEINNYDDYAKSAKRNVAHHQDMLRIFSNNDSREELNQAKERYNEYIVKKNRTEEKAKKIAAKLNTMLNEEEQFIGFKVWHRYRADNNAGMTMFGEVKFLMDKDLNSIFALYNTEDEEYKIVESLFKQMCGEESTSEKINLEDLKFYDE